MKTINSTTPPEDDTPPNETGFLPNFVIPGEQGASEIPSPPKPLNPSELTDWRLPDECGGALEEEKQVVAEIRKPKNTEWFQVHPKKDDWAVCYIYAQPGAGRETTYIVVPRIAAIMADCVKKVFLVPFSTADNTIGFWAMKVPEPGQKMAWHTSAIAIAESARTTWHRMVADCRNGFYKAVTAVNPRPAPDWPDRTVINSLLNAAVGDRLIDSEEHPVVKEYLMQ